MRKPRPRWEVSCPRPHTERICNRIWFGSSEQVWAHFITHRVTTIRFNRASSCEDENLASLYGKLRDVITACSGKDKLLPLHDQHFLWILFSWSLSQKQERAIGEGSVRPAAHRHSRGRRDVRNREERESLLGHHSPIVSQCILVRINNSNSLMLTQVKGRGGSCEDKEMPHEKAGKVEPGLRKDKKQGSFGVWPPNAWARSLPIPLTLHLLSLPACSWFLLKHSDHMFSSSYFNIFILISATNRELALSQFSDPRRGLQPAQFVWMGTNSNNGS